MTRAHVPRQVQHAEYVPEIDDYKKTMSGLKGLGSLTARRCVAGRGPASLSTIQTLGTPNWPGTSGIYAYSCQPNVHGRYVDKTVPPPAAGWGGAELVEIGRGGASGESAILH